MQALLGGLLKNRQLVSSMRRVMVMSLWEQVVGALVAKKSWPEKVDDGVLYIGVTSHAWAAELQLLKASILARYRQLLGRAVLKDVVFRVARRKARLTESDTCRIELHPGAGERLPIDPLPDTLFSGIANDEVRALLTPVFLRLRAQRAWKHEHGWSRCPECRHIVHGDSCPQCGSHIAAE